MYFFEWIYLDQNRNKHSKDTFHQDKKTRENHDKLGMVTLEEFSKSVKRKSKMLNFYGRVFSAVYQLHFLKWAFHRYLTKLILKWTTHLKR